MPTDAKMFNKLVLKTAEVLDPADPMKKVFQDIVSAMGDKKMIFKVYKDGADTGFW